MTLLRFLNGAHVDIVRLVGQAIGFRVGQPSGSSTYSGSRTVSSSAGARSERPGAIPAD
jgi:hypothetical protein